MVVQCGDFMDRDGRSTTVNTSHNIREEIDIIQYIYYLNKQASKVGGRVISLLGNHELSTVFMKKIIKISTVTTSQRLGGLSTKQKLFAPGGLMAKYLSHNCPLVVRVGNYLFMHGGISCSVLLKLKVRRISELNHMMKQYLCGRKFQNPKIRESLLYIVWDRTLSLPKITDDVCVDRLRKLLITSD